MSILKDDSNLSGMMGEVITVRKINGKMVVKNRPKRKVTKKPSADLESVQDRFEEAAAYAKKELRDPQSKAAYKAAINQKQRSAYAVALVDYLTPPKVKSIATESYKGAIGNFIVANVKDDFMVTAVTIIILDGSGVEIERGDALGEPSKTGLWKYTATVANLNLPGTTIKAIAYDRPGNRGFGEVKL